jgi:3D (Asp-Asp-Asp) domain-containing protein
LKKILLKRILPILLTLTLIMGVTTSLSIPAFAATAETYYVTAKSGLNIRSGGGVNYKKVGLYKYGTKVTVTKTSKNWCKTSKGWVSKTWLSKKNPKKVTQNTTAVTTDKGYKRTIKNVKVTAYCACTSCNGYWSSGNSTQTAIGITLRNNSSYANKYCAATPAVGKLGEVVTFKAKGKTYKVKIVDRLGSSSGYKIDLFVPNHSNCYKFGVQYGTTVKVCK